MSGLQNNYSMCFNANLKKHFWWININCDCLLKAHNVSGPLATDILHSLMLTMLKNRRVDVTGFDSNTWRVGTTRSDRKRWGKERVSKERQDDRTNKGVESGFEPRLTRLTRPLILSQYHFGLWILAWVSCLSILLQFWFVFLIFQFEALDLWTLQFPNVCLGFSLAWDLRNTPWAV